MNMKKYRLALLAILPLLITSFTFVNPIMASGQDSSVLPASTPSEDLWDTIEQKGLQLAYHKKDRDGNWSLEIRSLSKSDIFGTPKLINSHNGTDTYSIEILPPTGYVFFSGVSNGDPASRPVSSSGNGESGSFRFNTVFGFFVNVYQDGSVGYGDDSDVQDLWIKETIPYEELKNAILPFLSATTNTTYELKLKPDSYIVEWHLESTGTERMTLFINTDYYKADLNELTGRYITFNLSNSRQSIMARSTSISANLRNRYRPVWLEKENGQDWRCVETSYVNDWLKFQEIDQPALDNSQLQLMLDKIGELPGNLYSTNEIALLNAKAEQTAALMESAENQEEIDSAAAQLNYDLLSLRIIPTKANLNWNESLD